MTQEAGYQSDVGSIRLVPKHNQRIAAQDVSVVFGGIEMGESLPEDILR